MLGCKIQGDFDRWTFGELIESSPSLCTIVSKKQAPDLEKTIATTHFLLNELQKQATKDLEMPENDPLCDAGAS